LYSMVAMISKYPNTKPPSLKTGIIPRGYILRNYSLLCSHLIMLNLSNKQKSLNCSSRLASNTPK
jgi:hypothetical protein